MAQEVVGSATEFAPRAADTVTTETSSKPLRLADFEALARAKLPKMVFDYYASGANDELTLQRNRQAWEQISLHYRVLVDVSRCNSSCSLLGSQMDSPVLVAPAAFQGLAHPEGELATARSAGAQGSVMVLSTLSTSPVEEVVAASTGPVWFQLYVYRDRGVTADLVQRVEAAGCEALVVTVDAPLLGQRERDVRNQFHLPPEIRMENLVAAGYEGLPIQQSESGLAAYFASLIDPSLCWSDLEWLRNLTRLPLLLKGVVRADDTRRAVEHGAAGVIVSNHGGRQLDTAPATATVLPRITEAAGDDLEVLVDGGIRRGTDVVKALAMGASGVLVGRPVLWGLAAGGEEGVSNVLRLLNEELQLAMALCGCPDISSVTADLLA